MANDPSEVINPILQYDGIRLSLAEIVRHIASRIQDGDPTALMALGDLADRLRYDYYKQLRQNPPPDLPPALLAQLQAEAHFRGWEENVKDE